MSIFTNLMPHAVPGTISLRTALRLQAHCYMNAADHSAPSRVATTLTTEGKLWKLYSCNPSQPEHLTDAPSQRRSEHRNDLIVVENKTMWSVSSAPSCGGQKGILTTQRGRTALCWGDRGQNSACCHAACLRGLSNQLWQYDQLKCHYSIK